MEIVDDYSDIIVDVAICGYAAPPATTVSKNAKANWDAMKTVRDYYISSMSVIGELRAYPGLDMRFYFQERNSCPGAGGLSFDNSTTWCMQEAGRADAKAMLDIGSDKVAKTLEEWYDNYELKKEYPYFREYLNKVYSYIFE